MSKPLHVKPVDLTPSERGTAAHHLLEICLKAGDAPLAHMNEVVVADWGEGEDHARLSPSSAYRWLACPGVIDRQRDLPHPPRVAKDTLVDADMVRGVEVATDVLRPLLSGKHHGKVLAYGFETKVDIPVTNEFGTVDFWCLLQPAAGLLVLYVVDYKNGRHAVEAKKNEQMMLYTQGVLAKTLAYHKGQDLKVVNVIVQPNAMTADAVVQWETTKSGIVKWCQDIVRPTVAAINKGGADLIAGDHCKNCKVAAVDENVCPKLAALAARLTKLDWANEVHEKPEVPRGPDMLVSVVAASSVIQSFLKACEKEAMRMLVKNPKSLPGLKVVEGRANRQWTDKDVVTAAFRKLDINPDEYAPRTLVGLGDGEKLVPKPKREQFMQEFTNRPHGKPVLAAASDPRPAINSDAALDFANDIVEE